ncbi:hypothetical protein [Nonomuraea sp. NPDC049695]|uniref:hypothetical protein n=1 Tax=Nonomuraea sp. NPDC049695 TaxID=3154734 RepID=UPI00341B63C0
MTERIYQFVADEAQVDAAGAPPRPASLRAVDRVFWNIPWAELADVPVLRRWLREHGVTDTHESGGPEPLQRPSSSLEEPYSIASDSWTVWKGPELTRLDQCEGCGLTIHMVAPPTEIAPRQISNVVRKLAKTPLTFLPAPRAYVADSELVEAVRSAGLDEGLVTRPVDSRGRALLIWSDAALGGPAYPYGPEPCAVCGRAARATEGGRQVALPDYAYELTFEAEPAHWSWSTVYGQQTPLVSHEVAEFLLGVVPRVRFRPHGRPDNPYRFLPEPYR